MAANRQLVLPKLGLTMTEGAVLEWCIVPGARFTAGQTIFVVECDKAAVEFDAPADGVLHEILVPAGETVPVGTEIGRWSLDGDDTMAGPTDSERPPASAPTSPVAAASPRKAHQVRQSSTPVAKDEASFPRVVATPLARRRAAPHGLDLTGVTGSGPRGRVLAADVEAALQAHEDARERTSSDFSARAHAPESAAGPVAPTASQRTMAARVTASKREIPHFYLSIDVDVGELFVLRRSINELPGRPRVSVTHFLVAAVVEALRQTPAMNRVWLEGGLLDLPTVDVGLAVDTSHGLMSPVIRDLASQSFFGIVRSVDAAIGRARTASLRAADVQGGAITISNAGMHDVRYMSSIIVPGQSAILGVGSVQSCFRPDADGRPVLRRELGLVLSADHRIHTGVSALGFLNRLKSIVQRPVALLAGI